MIKVLANLIFIISASHVFGQFAPAAGQIGTTAIFKDSSVFISWASELVNFLPGPEDLTNNQSPPVSFGTASNALGPAEGNSFDAVSLGDGGTITIGFTHPIMNGNGPDFAVFENSFSETYLEFAFVEVSSNGLDFVRFPAVSNSQTLIQTGAFDSTDPTKIYNLAGKYKQGYGVPFDLVELIDSSAINIDSINFVRLIDVVGSIDSIYGSYDSGGNIINDPFPSPFNSSGFDLDAIGVIHQNNPLVTSEFEMNTFVLYPNPAVSSFYVSSSKGHFLLSVLNMQGEKLMRGRCNEILDCAQLSNGIYLIVVDNSKQQQIIRLVVQH